MTRFQQEISGLLGAFWKLNAENEAKAAAEHAAEAAIVDEHGAISWKSNGRYLPDDYCEKLEYARYPFSREATAAARQVQVAEDLAEYRRNYHEPSAEEMREMRATFGEGATVIDVLSGAKIQL